MSKLTLTTGDGERLEAIHDSAVSPTGVIVLCHPHPEHGGTMRAPILGAIAKHAISEGLDVLRFNFRGVGASSGSHGDGHAELHDVDAAMVHAASLAVPVVGLSGWSFGAAVSLKWQASVGSTVPYAGIAPPVRSPLTPQLPEPSELEDATRGFIIGERDQFIRADDLATYAASISAEIIRYRGTDHFFVLKHKQLAEDVVKVIRGSSIGATGR